MSAGSSAGSSANNANKRVSFSNDIVYETYSSLEYDRHPIHSTIYLKSLNKISIREWRQVVHALSTFKDLEMAVHIDSI